MHERVLEALRRVIDPELGIDVVSLGLVYGVEVEGDDVAVHLTMTTAARPLGEQIVEEPEGQLRALDGVGRVEVTMVWERACTPERMSEQARETLRWSPR